MIELMLEGWRAEVRSTGRWTLATARLIRLAALVARHRGLARSVVDQPAFRWHIARVANGNPLFFFAYRSYLVRGLAQRGRALAALQHYGNETRAMRPEYQQAVYEMGGLLLWRHVHEATVFEIRLVPGTGVLMEGGLSVLFRIGGQQATVLSYCNVDPALLDGAEAAPAAAAGRLVPFITRSQSFNGALRRPFSDAFGRGTPAHFCLAALEGIALAQGIYELRGVPATRHLCSDRLWGDTELHPMYDQLWKSHCGERTGALSWVIPLPLRCTPLAQLASDKRRRALKLRRHMAAVRDAAYEAYWAQLRSPPSRVVLPAPGKSA